MSNQNYTAWFPGSTLPVRAGYYEVRNNRYMDGRHRGRLFGSRKRYFTGRIWLTEKQGHLSIFGSHDSHEWRGFTEAQA